MVSESPLVDIQCLHIRYEVQLSLNPPSSKLPRLSAETTATVPLMTSDFPWTTNFTPAS